MYLTSTWHRFETFPHSPTKCPHTSGQTTGMNRSNTATVAFASDQSYDVYLDEEAWNLRAGPEWHSFIQDLLAMGSRCSDDQLAFEANRLKVELEALRKLYRGVDKFHKNEFLWYQEDKCTLPPYNEAVIW
jgi:hypothetical protein